jgi:D-alanyl-D-alanine carboxypeptidase
MRLIKNRKILGSLLVAALLTAVVYLAWPNNSAAPSLGLNPSNHTAIGNTPPAGFNKRQFSTTDPASTWVVVNKQHSLNPLNYVPGDLTVPNVPLRAPGNESMQLRRPAAAALEEMFSAATATGLDLMLSSGYRSYSYQVGLYNGYVKSDGQTAADQSSARPGHSEHQTGLAADVEPTSRRCELATCFADTPEGKWLAANDYKYGFILRYTPDKVSITGYESEPWHFRYVGQALAAELHSQNIATLEEFFGVSGGTSY